VASTKRKKRAAARSKAGSDSSARSPAKIGTAKINPLLRAEVEAFAALHQVTPREREVLMWMAAGRGSAEELAEILGRSINTIQNHIKGLLRGIGTNSKSGALALFIEYLLTGRGGKKKR
jgi:DNA-binding CsgD family transcriptional regulator